MNRNRIAVLIVALLCVGALAVVAGTVDPPRDSGPGTGGGGGGTSGPAETPEVTTPTEAQGDRIEIPAWLRTAALVLFAVSILIAAVLTALNLSKRRATLLVVTVLVMMVVGGVLYSIVLDMVTQREPSQSGPQETTTQNDNGTGSPGDADRESDAVDRQFDVPLVLLGLFGLVALALVGAISRFSGSEESVAVSAHDDEEAAAAERIEEVAEAAGRAADELEADDGDVENTVYRAWREMTDALSVEQPRTTSPEEFAAVAVDAGMDAEDVRELTWLFEEVRYGDAPVTDDRERRARSALRRIEGTYADGRVGLDGDGGADDE